MKVNGFPLSRAFKKGLRPKIEMDHDPEYLSLATNIYLSKDGCFNAEKFTRTFALDEHAQIFPTYKGVFVLTGSALYSYIAPTLTPLLTGLSIGGLWSCADFGEYVLFTNGSVNLIRNPTTGVFATDSGVVFPLATSICAHRGRLILGGPKNYPYAGDANTNWVAWSDINNLDFLHTPLLTTTIATLATQVSFTLTAGSAVDDTYNDMIAVITDAGDSTVKAYAPILDYTGSTKTITLNVDPAIFTMAVTDEVKIFDSTDNNQARQNLAGYMPMPWEGSILRLATLDDKVVVYGDNGITAMKLASVQGAASTYGQVPIYNLGLIEQSAMTTNDKEDEGKVHYFVDSVGWLNKLGVDLQVDRLGYKEFFEA